VFKDGMKRGVLFVFLLVLLVASVNAASIELGQSLKEEYNLGDVIDLDGKVTSEEARRDLFRLDIKCGDKSWRFLNSWNLPRKKLQIHRLVCKNQVFGECPLRHA